MGVRRSGHGVIWAILDRSDLELAGVKVFSAHKDGVDAGELVGRPLTGVLASVDVATALAIDADCVAYMPRHASVEEVCAILESDKNVVSTAFLFHPARLATAERDRLLAACTAGGTSVHGTGFNPGNLSRVLPLALSGMSRSIEKVTLQERADWSHYESTAITFDNTRFVRPLEDVTEEASEFLRFNSGIFIEEVWLIGDSLGAGLEEVTTEVEVVPALADHDIFGFRLAAGTAAGQRWRRRVPAVLAGPTRNTAGLSPSTGTPRSAHTCSPWPAANGSFPSLNTSAPRASPPRCKLSTQFPLSARRRRGSPRWLTCR